ncbi:MAG: adenosylmethionine--8-amino-7-oxononanoate transaminase [Acidobacteria bacterium]|nr:MAG: adenosylmethionine--8-amino-7-oxononanoate transaminase [Acidobacteriota bacterium]
MKIWHPYTQEAVEPPPIAIDRAEGAYLYTAGGQRLLDAISSWWVNLHGHGHPLIAEGIAKQARKLEHVIFAGFTHEPAEELSSRLAAILPPPLHRLFYSDNGSTAVEIAMKMAVQVWHNKGRPEKRRIVALRHAYHGDTVGAMSASADSPFTAAFDALRVPVLRVHSAYCYRCPVGKTRSSCVIDCAQDLEQLLEQRHEEIAAVIVEPLLQAAGGMIVHPIEFLQRVRRASTKHDVLLIADEVFTGFGRTGRMFACELADIVPDVMCLSKGLTGGFLPLAVTICREEVYQAFYSQDRLRAFFHGHSYSGNPLGCAAAIASLNIFETEPVFERIAAIECIHRERLAGFRNHPAVDDVRMLGTVAALELRAADPGYLSNLRSRLYRFFIDHGVLLRPLGNVVYTVPPYVISDDELHRIYDVIGKALGSGGLFS